MHLDPNGQTLAVMRLYRKHSSEIGDHGIKVVLAEAGFREPRRSRLLIGQLERLEKSGPHRPEFLRLRRDSKPCGFCTRKLGEKNLFSDYAIVPAGPRENVEIGED